MTITEADLADLVRKWQPVLGLSDWRVKVSLKRAADLKNGSAEGENATVLARKLAHISIANPDELSVDLSFAPDPEHTIVHELLHCHFAPFMSEKHGSLKHIAQEQAIDLIANALVALDRRATAP